MDAYIQMLLFVPSPFQTVHSFPWERGKTGDQSTNFHTFSQTLKAVTFLLLFFFGSVFFFFFGFWFLFFFSPQELSVSDIKSESLHFAIASTAAVGTSCFTSSAKSLQLWQDWTRLTINLTFSRFVLYFLKSSLPRKLPKQLLGENCKQNMLDLVTSLCQKNKRKKNSVCLGFYFMVQTT